MKRLFGTTSRIASDFFRGRHREVKGLVDSHDGDAVQRVNLPSLQASRKAAIKRLHRGYTATAPEEPRNDHREQDLPSRHRILLSSYVSAPAVLYCLELVNSRNCWLYGEIVKLRSLLFFRSELMEAYEVSRLVNDPQNDSLVCIEPAIKEPSEVLFPLFENSRTSR
jgi:hypothetical protein